MWYLDWLVLLTLAGFFVFVVWATNNCATKEGRWRLIGILVAVAVGGTYAGVGYWFAFEGFTVLEQRPEGFVEVATTYPVFGRLTLVGGILTAMVGTWISLQKVQQE